jgi:hypothetical protein
MLLIGRSSHPFFSSTITPLISFPCDVGKEAAMSTLKDISGGGGYHLMYDVPDIITLESIE